MASIEDMNGTVIADMDLGMVVSLANGDKVGFVAGNDVHGSDTGFIGRWEWDSEGVVSDQSGKPLGRCDGQGAIFDLSGSQVAKSSQFNPPQMAGGVYWLLVRPNL